MKNMYIVILTVGFGLVFGRVSNKNSISVSPYDLSYSSKKGEINNLTKDELLKELQEEFVSCKDVQFTLLGLSLASINVLISLILSVITLKLFLNYEKNI